MAKAKFMKHFMYEYRKSEDWVGDFERNLDLKLEYLLSPKQDGLEQEDVSKPAAGTSQKRRGPRMSSTASGERKRFKSTKKCFTRLEQSKGKCFHKNCIFDHACACCGADHAAVDCPTWDDAKGSRALAAARELLRKRD